MEKITLFVPHILKYTKEADKVDTMLTSAEKAQTMLIRAEIPFELNMMNNDTRELTVTSSRKEYKGLNEIKEFVRIWQKKKNKIIRFLAAFAHGVMCGWSFNYRETV